MNEQQDPLRCMVARDGSQCVHVDGHQGMHSYEESPAPDDSRDIVAEVTTRTPRCTCTEELTGGREWCPVHDDFAGLPPDQEPRSEPPSHIPVPALDDSRCLVETGSLEGAVRAYGSACANHQHDKQKPGGSRDRRRKQWDQVVREITRLRALTEGERTVWVDQQTPDDCWTACLSSLTGIPLSGFPDPPDVRDPEDEEAQLMEIGYGQSVRKHLNDNGWMLRPWDGVRLAPKGLSVATGPSPRRPGFNHCVVARDGTIIYDPHPSRDGLLEITEYEIVVPLIIHDPPTTGEDGP